MNLDPTPLQQEFVEAVTRLLPMDTFRAITRSTLHDKRAEVALNDPALDRGAELARMS